MPLLHLQDLRIGEGDALLLVDVQNDFLPGGSLGVPTGDEIVPLLNRAIRLFTAVGRSVYATRDWHPPKHCSFRDRGGPWPPHCVQGTWGAKLAPLLELPAGAVLVSKGSEPDRDAYSGFEGTNLEECLHAARVHHLFVGGLATDYCVLNTVRDALDRGFAVSLLTDAVRAVDVRPQDGERALREMLRLGAVAGAVGPHAPETHATR